MAEPLALPTEAEISTFTEHAIQGFAQTCPYAPYFLVACALAIVWVEHGTRSHTPSNALLVFLAIAIPTVLARRVSLQVLLSWFPRYTRDALVIAGGVAELWPAYLVACCIWVEVPLTFVYALKDTQIDWLALACKLLQFGWRGCASLCRTSPTESMLPQMGLLMLLVFVATVLYENAFGLLYETAIFLRFVWLVLHWLVVPRMIKCSKTKEIAEAVKDWMATCPSKLAGMLCSMAGSAGSDAAAAGTPPPPTSASAGSALPPVALDGTALLKLTNDELRAMLAARGLSKSGAKHALVNRLVTP